MIDAAGVAAGAEHRRARHGETLLGAVVDGRDARHGHQQQQRLLQARFAAAGEEAIDVVIVQEGRHQPGPGVHAHHAQQAVGQLGRGPPACEHVADAGVEREVEHAGQQRRSVRPAHQCVDTARLRFLVGSVGGEAFAEDLECLAAGGPGNLDHTGGFRIRRRHEVSQRVGRHVERRIDAKRVHARLADPVAVTLAQGLAYARVGAVEVIQGRHLEIVDLRGVLVVDDGRGPVVDAGGPLPRIARIVEGERPLGRRRAPAAVRPRQVELARIGRIPTARVVEVVAGVVEDDVLHQEHARAVQLARQPLVIGQAAQVGVHRHEIFRPVPVVAAMPGRRVPPPVGDRRSHPDRGRPQAADVVQPAFDAGQVAAVIAGRVVGPELARALVVVAWIAIVETIGHHEVDDLVAPVRRGDVQALLGRSRHLRHRHGRGGGEQDRQAGDERGRPGIPLGLPLRRNAGDLHFHESDSRRV